MRLLLVVLIVAFNLLSGCGSDSTDQKSNQTKQAQARAAKPFDTIVIDLCKLDPQNADMWRQTGINLFSDPTLGPKKKVGNIPACDGITVDVIDKKTFEGVEFYWIRYKKQIGWQTKRLLTGVND
ncbi:MAG TPA: hypothetical protein PLF13_10325 [candidate division Zixibacteria bacterium]|nr:hypothetical protein [candidate division Zixibacteria bacterium]